MKKSLLYLLLICCSTTMSFAQTDEGETAVIGVIKTLFDGMRAGDSMTVQDLFADKATLSSIIKNNEGKIMKRTNDAGGFVTAIGTPHDEIWDEQIWSYDINIDGLMANAWTEYTFYRGDQLSHCGVNSFELIHLDEGWRISAITDTRRRTDCKTDPVKDINQLMVTWHKAAATADEDIFFGSMTSDGIYIGTDATERWTRDEMKEWSKPYFDKESAWSFTTKSRNVDVSEDGQIAWFDELLDTWMGDCRASGVLRLTEDGWKIAHYHLSIAVPNDQVNDYLELIGKPRN